MPGSGPLVAGFLFVLDGLIVGVRTAPRDGEPDNRQDPTNPDRSFFRILLDKREFRGRL